MCLYVCKQTFHKLYGYIRMLNFQGIHLPHRQSSLGEGRIFQYKVSFPLNFISLKKILQWVKSRTRMLFMFSVWYFKLWKRNKLILHFLEKIKPEAVAQKCSIRKVFSSGLPQACNFIRKETLAQVFSCEFCEIPKNTFSYRTPLVAASVNCF